MDYGYQLLRHVFQQVFGNLGQAARLTLLLMALPAIVLLAVTGGQTGAEMEGSGSIALWLLLIVILGIGGLCWSAVGWHRYVLLEETGTGIVPAWNGARIGAYFVSLIKVGLITIGAAIAAGLVLLIVATVTQSQAITLLMVTGVTIAVSWISTRIGLILPAAAIGERLTIKESWAATDPVSSQILLPIIVISVVVGLASGFVTLAFGQSVPGGIVQGGVSWLQLLINLALMTTLYGNLIQGRALN